LFRANFWKGGVLGCYSWIVSPLYAMSGKLEAAWGMVNILSDQDSVLVIRTLLIDTGGIFSVHHNK